MFNARHVWLVRTSDIAWTISWRRQSREAHRAASYTRISARSIVPNRPKMPSSRPRRLFLLLLSIPLLLFFLLYLGSPTSRRTISDLFSTSAYPSKLPDEIFGLLHFVTSPDEAGRVLSAVDDPTPDVAEEVALENGAQLGDTIVPDKAVELAWYALGSIARTAQRAGGKGLDRSASGGWDERLKVLRGEYPLVVFSKVSNDPGWQVVMDSHEHVGHARSVVLPVSVMCQAPDVSSDYAKVFETRKEAPRDL